MIYVITSSKELEFKAQGKIANSTNMISVKLNHDIQCKLNDGSLLEVAKCKDATINKDTESAPIGKKSKKKVTTHTY